MTGLGASFTVQTAVRCAGGALKYGADREVGVTREFPWMYGREAGIQSQKSNHKYFSSLYSIVFIAPVMTHPCRNQVCRMFRDLLL